MSEEQNTPTRRINLRLLRLGQVILMAITGLLLVSHILKWDVVQVDSITLALIGLLLLIPFADLIRKIKLGQFEAEIGRDEVAKAQAKAAAELPPSTESQLDISEDEVRELLQRDPRLAMAKIRIELEEALKRLYSATIDTQPDLRRTSLSRLVDALVQREVIGGPVASSVRDVLALANRAVHGERVEQDAAHELAILGVRLIREIRQAYSEHALKPVERNVITAQEVTGCRTARYKLTTIVPLVDEPTKNVYIVDHDALELFLEGYDEYGEFIVALEQV